jgi:hypothetical protein
MPFQIWGKKERNKYRRKKKAERKTAVTAAGNK